MNNHENDTPTVPSELAREVSKALRLGDVMTDQIISDATKQLHLNDDDAASRSLKTVVALCAVLRPQIDDARARCGIDRRHTIKKIVLSSIFSGDNGLIRNPLQRPVDLPADPDTVLIALGFQNFFAKALLPGGKKLLEKMIRDMR